MKSNIYIIGCGGVGSWLAPALALLTSPESIVLMDADKLEEKNLNRQLFKKSDIGKTKSDALAEQYKCRSIPEWFTEGLIELEPEDWLIVCVDNHVARRAALYEADRYGCKCIIAANETHSAEAYFYERKWRESAIDPRVYYPDILTDRSGDPQRAAIGCTGQAQVANPQLVTSNSLAASLAGHLFALWHLEAKNFTKKTEPYMPYHLVASMTRLTTHLIKDKIPTKGQQNERPIDRGADIRGGAENSAGAGDSERGSDSSTTVSDPAHSDTNATANA